MKEFFLNLLSNLDKLAGLRQIEKIYAQHTDINDAKREISGLLDILVNICKQFHYIPEKEQQRIIQQAVVTDPEFTSLNARIVYKWLNTHRDKYYKEIAHVQENDPNWEPIPKSDPRYQEHLANWLKALEPMMERVNVTEKSEVKILGYERPVGERIQHDNGLTKFDVELQTAIRQVASEKYKGKNTSRFVNFTVGKLNVFAETLEDAKQIIEEAEKRITE